MPNMPGIDASVALTNAYQVLVRRRQDAHAERERIAREIAKLDAAVEVLRDLVTTPIEDAALGGSAELAEPEGTEVATFEANGSRPLRTHSARAIDRRVRVIELLLENPSQWFSSSDVAKITERPIPTSAQRNAVSETLRRLLQHGKVERDDSIKPVRYRAIPAALRELLLTE